MRILVFLIFGITMSACSGLMMAGGAGSSGTGQIDRPTPAQAGNTVIADRVKASYAADPVASKLAINVSASGGMVTLYGTVPSYGARETAEKLAMATEGVKAVDNKITVDYK